MMPPPDDLPLDLAAILMTNTHIHADSYILIHRYEKLLIKSHSRGV